LLTTLRAVADSAVRPPPADEVSGIEQILSEMTLKPRLFTVAAGEVRIRHGVREVAVHKLSEGRCLRIVDSAHLEGVAGRDGAIRRPEIAAPLEPASSPPHSLLRPLAEYEAAIGGSF
jgi:hypothetical protein